MMTGAHVMLFSKDADADRAFVRDHLGMDHVDAGGGWLIFKLPPSDLAFHPGGSQRLAVRAIRSAKRCGDG